ncbi:TfoX/Sxy family protein [Chitinophaga sp.]|uniref:TfoX/Sxy family protein n=1 Tax=Chitinophaga sp. TaxID=1869181 RepID=UPI0031DFCE91
MALNEKLMARVRELIAAEENDVEEKKMFGGCCFMVNDKMCVCVRDSHIMVRLNPAGVEEALELPGASQMVLNGRTMKGYVYVDESALGTRKQLAWWVGKALAFNHLARSSKQKKK